MKMCRRPRWSSVTYRFRYAPLLAPCRRHILIATKAILLMRQDTEDAGVGATTSNEQSDTLFSLTNQFLYHNIVLADTAATLRF